MSSFQSFSRDHCPVCNEASADTSCAHCGADAFKIRQLFRSFDSTKIRIPSLWQFLRGAPLPFEETSEAIWAEITPEYQQTVLSDYRQKRERAESLRVIILVPLMIALMISGICSGAVLARRMGFGGGKPVEFLFGFVAMFPLLFLRAAPIENAIDRLLIRHSRWVQEERIGMENVPEFIHLAIMRRCRLPWYLNSDVLFPISQFIAATAAWFII